MDLVINIDEIKEENLKMIKEIENLKKKIEDNINLIQQNLLSFVFDQNQNFYKYHIEC